MKTIRNILVIIPGILFLLSSTGVLVFHSHCSCTGNDQISFYMAPETCEDNFHTHHTHNRSGEEVPASLHECHECQTHTDDCGCNDPDVHFLKLNDQVFQEKVRIESSAPVLIAILASSIAYPETDHHSEQAEISDPPPLIWSALDFLIRIQQLKIPVIA